MFDPEIAVLSPTERRAVVAAADVVVSWEAFDLMHNDQGLPVDQVHTAMGGALARLLVPAAGSGGTP